MKPKCPFCGGGVPPESIDVLRTVCPECYASFASTELVADKGSMSRKPEIRMPDGLSVRKEGLDLVISYVWFSFGYVLLLPVCAVWDWLVLLFYRGFARMKEPFFVWLFPLGHVAVGVGLTYYTLAKLLNRTRIRVSPRQLSIEHLPLPWPGGKVLPAGDLDQIFCEERVRRSRRGILFYSYAIVAQRRDGTRVEIVRVLETREQALYIEQQIETHLRIKDRPVRGEMRQFEL